VDMDSRRHAATVEIEEVQMPIIDDLKLPIEPVKVSGPAVDALKRGDHSALEEVGRLLKEASKVAMQHLKK